VHWRASFRLYHLVSTGKSVHTIGNSAFRGTRLTEVVIPDSVKTIGSNVFYNVPITKVTIDNSVVTIGDGLLKVRNSLRPSSRTL
jgi:hypothetical protein